MGFLMLQVRQFPVYLVGLQVHLVGELSQLREARLLQELLLTPLQLLVDVVLMQQQQERLMSPPYLL
jgi:hypothetical protein